MIRQQLHTRLMVSTFELLVVEEEESIGHQRLQEGVAEIRRIEALRPSSPTRWPRPLRSWVYRQGFISSNEDQPAIRLVQAFGWVGRPYPYLTAGTGAYPRPPAA